MSISCSPERIANAAALLAPLCLSACFDVENVDVSKALQQRLVLDDFEDGDTLPASRLFGPWACYAFSDFQPRPTCDFSPGFSSQFAYSLTFNLESSTTLDIGAGVGLPAATGTVDLSSHKHLHIDARLNSGGPVPLPDFRFRLGMACNSVPHQPGNNSDDFKVTRVFTVADVFDTVGDWQSITVPLASFEQPRYQEVYILNKSDCPKLVDSILIELDVPFASAVSAAGTLEIDNVWLE